LSPFLSLSFVIALLYNLSTDTLNTNDVVISTEKNGLNIVLPKHKQRTICTSEINNEIEKGGTRTLSARKRMADNYK
jgi:hypothetical protein